MSQKVVLKVELHDDRIKQKAMKKVSGIPGVESVSVEMKDNKLTIIGEIDPVTVVAKLRKMKLTHTQIVSVGPAKAEKKKEEPKKEEPKKGEKEKKEDPPKVVPCPVCGVYYCYHVRPPYYYYVRPVEEDPNACVIC